MLGGFECECRRVDLVEWVQNAIILEDNDEDIWATPLDVQAVIRKFRTAICCCQGKRLNANVERAPEEARYGRPVFRARWILQEHFEEKSTRWEVEASTQTIWCPIDMAMLRVTAAGDAELTPEAALGVTATQWAEKTRA